MRRPAHARIVKELEALGSTCADPASESYVREALDRIHTPRHSEPPADTPFGPDAVARLIDHTQLNPDATDAHIRRLCEEARTYEFAAVCVHPWYVPLAAETLTSVSIPVCTVVGFPHGANRSSTKAYEAARAIEDGAAEIDMVLAIGRLKSGHFEAVEADVRAVVDAVRGASVGRDSRSLVKVILETALLTDAEKAVACIAARRAGADYVKTSTGFSTEGATTHDVALLHQVVGDDLGVKAAGGIRSFDDVRAMVAHGASRIGASGGVAIMQGLTSETNY